MGPWLCSSAQLAGARLLPASSHGRGRELWPLPSWKGPDPISGPALVSSCKPDHPPEAHRRRPSHRASQLQHVRFGEMHTSDPPHAPHSCDLHAGVLSTFPASCPLSLFSHADASLASHQVPVFAVAINVMAGAPLRQHTEHVRTHCGLCPEKMMP